MDKESPDRTDLAQRRRPWWEKVCPVCGVTRHKQIGVVVFWVPAVVAVGTIVVLMVASGLHEVRQNLDAGEPWFSGFQAGSLAIPISALIAAGVAITTARWGLHSARETRDADQKRWKEERDADRTRWEAERDADRTRWETDRAIEAERRKAERRDATERTLRDRFHELIKLLSAEELRVREGAAYAVAALADDWEAHYEGHNRDRARAEQQVCINVLIAQLHDPFPSPVEDSASYARMAGFKEAIQTIISSRLCRVDGSEAQPGVWSSFAFNFDACTFKNLDLSGCIFDGPVSFREAFFTGPSWFSGAHFRGKTEFDDASFAGDPCFDGALFAGDSPFEGYGSDPRFDGARFNVPRDGFPTCVR